MKELLQACLTSSSVQIFGFYSREFEPFSLKPPQADPVTDFGQSYASKSLETASDYFRGEIECVNTAAKVARSLGAKGEWTLSVGATPTAHAAVQETQEAMKGLEGTLELYVASERGAGFADDSLLSVLLYLLYSLPLYLPCYAVHLLGASARHCSHAGNYCVCDLQQFATSLVQPTDLALTVVARVVSLYPHRKEAMCDAGALAVSKDTGPLAGYGHVISPPHATAWDLGRISQEHGTLTHRPRGDKVGEASQEPGELKVGDVVRIVPQHACLVCAGYPWIYVVEDGGDKVVDVWVPWKGW